MSKDPIKIPAVFETIDETISVVGHHDKHLKIFEDYYNVEISLRGDQLYLFGDEHLWSYIVKEKKLQNVMCYMQ